MSEESELTFADIYQEILSQGKFSIEVPDAYAPIARQGVKNCKAYWNKKSKKAGIPTDDTTLQISEESLSDGYTKITWETKLRGAIPARVSPSFSATEILEDE